MTDEFSGQRLPDLPIVGYSGKKDKERTDVLMFFARGVERNRLLLLNIVCDGPEKFLKATKDPWGPYKIPNEKVLELFDYFVKLAGPHPHSQRELLRRGFDFPVLQ